MKRIAPLLLLAVLLVAFPGTAAAATRAVTMNNSYSFQPGSVNAARGDKVKWTNTGNIQHDVFSASIAGYFSSGATGGLHHNDSYSFTFTSAGTFQYICRLHSADGMTGYVVVPVGVAKLSSPTRFHVTAGSTKIASTSPYTHVYQVEKPGTSTWATFKTSKSGSVNYTPSTHGTYHFRAYLQSTNSHGFSQPSPAVAATY
jgi:plastocyanin